MTRSRRSYTVKDLCKWLRDNKYWKQANWLENNRDLTLCEALLSEVVAEHVDWSNTPQGSKFWDDIYDEVEEEEDYE